MTPQSRKVAVWVAHLLHVEADEIHYRWPPASDGERKEAERLARLAMRAGTFALRGVRGKAERDRIWREAHEAFSEDPERPAVDSDRPYLDHEQEPGRNEP